MMKIDSATLAIVVALIVYGLLTVYQPALGEGWNWVIAGVVAFLVSWAGMAGMKK
jgi:hypothetical protein